MAQYKPNDMEMPNPPVPTTDTIKKSPEPDKEKSKILPISPSFDTDKVGKE